MKIKKYGYLGALLFVSMLIAHVCYGEENFCGIKIISREIRTTHKEGDVKIIHEGTNSKNISKYIIEGPNNKIIDKIDLLDKGKTSCIYLLIRGLDHFVTVITKSNSKPEKLFIDNQEISMPLMTAKIVGEYEKDVKLILINNSGKDTIKIIKINDKDVSSEQLLKNNNISASTASEAINLEQFIPLDAKGGEFDIIITYEIQDGYFQGLYSNTKKDMVVTVKYSCDRELKTKIDNNNNLAKEITLQESRYRNLTDMDTNFTATLKQHQVTEADLQKKLNQSKADLASFEQNISSLENRKFTKCVATQIHNIISKSGVIGVTKEEFEKIQDECRRS
jgi:hypothetical protein